MVSIISNRNLNLNEEKTVSDIVTQNIKTAHVFKKQGSDFCCGGGITVQQACEKNNVNYEQLMSELTSVEKPTNQEEDFDAYELDQLLDFIINNHHVYVRESLPILTQYVNKVARVHGHHYNELLTVKDIFLQVKEELESHLLKEENILFPYVRTLVEANKQEVRTVQPPFGTVQNPVRMMEIEHDNAGDAFKAIARLTNNYTPPEGACNTFRALYAKLEEFEQDLHQHVHLENNILHPKAIVLEKAVNAGN
jgi:regulator of cell morphogenesis and NO signaling